MKVKLKGTNCMQDPKYIQIILAMNNIVVHKTKNERFGIGVFFTIEVKDETELNKVLLEINNNTSYGCTVVSRR